MTRWRTSSLLQWLAFGLLAAGVLMMRPVDLLSSLAMLITILTGLKLWEARRLPERRMVCLLQLLSAGLQAAMQPDLGSSLLQALAVVVALSGLLALEMGSGAHWGVLVRRSLGVVLAALPVALVLFLLVPRMPPIGVFPGGWGAAAVTGLSDTLEPGSIASLATSMAPAARVTFATGAPPTPPKARYWRVLVHEGFDGTRWTVQAEDPSQELRGWQEAREGTGPLTQVWLSEPSTLERLPWDGRGRPSSRQLRITAQGELVHRGPRGQRRAYGITADAQDQPWQRQRPGLELLALPRGTNPRLEALGASWAKGSPQERLQRLERWMRSHPFRYTREPGRLPAVAPMDAFLFERRQGFCGHFASAAAALMRAAGLPARVVSGYQGGSWAQPVSGPGYLDLRQANAHAWTEVWIEGKGWVEVDASLWVMDEGPAPAPVAVTGTDPVRWLQRQWWGIDLAWTRWWLGYDARSQEALLARLLGERRDLLGLLVLGGVATGLAGGLCLLGWLRRRGAGDPQRRELDRCLLSFARQGWVPRAGETLPQLAERIRQRWPQLDPELETFVTQYESQRFGLHRSELDSQNLRRSRRQLLRRWRRLS